MDDSNLRRQELAHAAADAALCQRCPLFEEATQVVFGEGPVDAAIMMVGEQPGEKEDTIGRPFVGPAGHILDDALAEAGLDRSRIYVTNAVKHFKHEQRGKRRLHKKPNQNEIEICRWWLERELALVEPKLIVALGATAARSLFSRSIVLSRNRGKLLRFIGNRPGVVTLHPSAILRVPNPAARHQAMSSFTDDIKAASRLAEAPDLRMK
jgi:uracil-DNA glycosylase